LSARGRYWGRRAGGKESGLKDYYAILEIFQTSSEDDIRRAFRRKAKALHPDVAADRARSDELFIELLEAYQILTNPDTRAEYDRAHRYIYGMPEKEKFDYRSFLKSRKDDKVSQSKLICFDLLHDRAEEALALYESLSVGHDFALENYLDCEDYMDFAFLLAEEYEQRGCYVKCYNLLRSIVYREQERPYFKHFFVEVIHKLRLLSGVRFPGDNEQTAKLTMLKEIAAFELPDKDKAFFYKKLSEVYHDRADYGMAAQYLQRALDLDERLAGAKKLKEKIRLS
jgi:curved DNA-binding protein CbpA